MAFDFSPYQAVLLDLDGTIYHEDHVLPGAAGLIARLQAQSLRYACLSNSPSSPLRILTRLFSMGIEIDPSHIYTAGVAAADYVVEKYRPRPRLYNMASAGIHDMLDETVDWVSTGGEPCDAVIVGSPANPFAREDRQRIALSLLRKGAELIAICADRVYPSPRGLEFGAGALSAMLAYAANTRPTYCGKPQEVFFLKLCQRLEVRPDQCLLIGDNLESDILGASAVGMQTVLTLTGVTRRRDLRHLPDDRQPRHVVEDLSELV